MRRDAMLLAMVLAAASLQGLESAAIAAVQLQSVVRGLSNPVYVTSVRDGSNRLFIVEQPGRIKVLQPQATVPTVFLDITARVLFGGEQGLLGLAFHPQFSVNRRFFVNYTRKTDGATVIAEYHASASDPDTADTAETPLLSIAQPFSNHNGGMIAFGPDGYLYIGMGDGGSGNDPGNRAQNIDDLLGKMLRIDVDHPDGSVPYSSPPTNPFFGPTPGRDETYAVGLRNPWRFSFDRGTGQLFCGDVGQGAREEVDIITLGGNFGWRVFEGTLCTNIDPALCPTLQSIAPIAEYDHSVGRCAITGGYVYRGPIATLPAGAYVYADFCTGEIFVRSGGSSSLLMDTALNISSFGEDEAGEVYVVGLGGTVDRMVNPDAPCAFGVNPTSQVFGAAGGARRLLVTAPSGCAWTASTNSGSWDWIGISAGQSGNGSGTVNYFVLPNNTGSTRAGTLTIAGQTFRVTQGGQ
jgi:glucose/arabinose dehydrogenase